MTKIRCLEVNEEGGDQTERSRTFEDERIDALRRMMLRKKAYQEQIKKEEAEKEKSKMKSKGNTPAD